MLTGKERRYLLKAKQMIANNPEEFICEALKLQNVVETKRLRKYIAKKLGRPYNSLLSWHLYRGITRAYAQRKQDRLDWIDWMLDWIDWMLGEK